MWRCIDPQVTHQKGDAAYPVSRMLSDGVRPRHIPVGELPEIEWSRWSCDSREILPVDVQPNLPVVEETIYSSGT